MDVRLPEDRQIAAVYRRFAVGAAAFFTIGSAQVAAAQQPTTLAADTSLLSAIIKAAISQAGRLEVRVEPRPLAAFPERYDVEPEAIARISPVDQHLRTAVIRGAGLRTVDATKVGQTENCRGIFAIGATDSLGHSDYHAGCPKENFYVLAVALPRPGSAVLPAGEVYDRDTERAARGYWAARVIRTNVGPGGSSVYAADYVLAKRAGSWVIVKMVGLIYLD